MFRKNGFAVNAHTVNTWSSDYRLKMSRRSVATSPAALRSGRSSSRRSSRLQALRTRSCTATATPSRACYRLRRWQRAQPGRLPLRRRPRKRRAGRRCGVGHYVAPTTQRCAQRENHAAKAAAAAARWRMLLVGVRKLAFCKRYPKLFELETQRVPRAAGSGCRRCGAIAELGRRRRREAAAEKTSDAVPDRTRHARASLAASHLAASSGVPPGASVLARVSWQRTRGHALHDAAAAAPALPCPCLPVQVPALPPGRVGSSSSTSCSVPHPGPLASAFSGTYQPEPRPAPSTSSSSATAHCTRFEFFVGWTRVFAV